MARNTRARLVNPSCMLLGAVGALSLLSFAQPFAASANAQAPTAEKPAAEKPDRVKIDREVDDFTLADIMDDHAAPKSILQHKGDKVIVLFFMMEKCAHTVRYTPRVAEIARKFKADVEFIGVRCNVDDSPDALRALVRKNKLAISVLDDTEGKLSRYFKVHVAPSFAVIDRSGILRYFGGFDNDAGHKAPIAPEPLLEPVIRTVLRGEDVRIKRGVPNGCIIRLPRN